MFQHLRKNIVLVISRNEEEEVDLGDFPLSPLAFNFNMKIFKEGHFIYNNEKLRLDTKSRKYNY